ncbi:GerMN domain-containing protein [Rothia uropygioeca]|uniref:GerMN domain-containing protein n=1 Tax=Kocuria sp. 257 TaxID=2021970 RepID=UPI0013EB2B15|nr:GerMN domain-containing protein [Kocuria sp. 257]
MISRTWRPVAGAVVVLCVLPSVLSGCGLLDAANKASESEESPTPTSSPSQSDRKVPLYWLGNTGKSSYLYREYRDYQADDAASAGDVVATAVSMLTRVHPSDPDYHNPWKPAKSVGSSMSTDGTLTLNVSSDIFDHSLSGDEANLAVQQLIYTATAAAAAGGIANAGPTMKVIILVDGHRGYRFGQQTLGQPMVRDDAVAAPLWIIDPEQDVVSTSNLSVKMVATNVASRVYWDIRKNGSEVASGNEELSGSESGLQEIQFSKTLSPGDYTIRIYIRTKDLRDPGLAVSDQDVSLYDDHQFKIRD